MAHLVLQIGKLPCQVRQRQRKKDRHVQANSGPSRKQQLSRQAKQAHEPTCGLLIRAATSALGRFRKFQLVHQSILERTREPASGQYGIPLRQMILAATISVIACHAETEKQADACGKHDSQCNRKALLTPNKQRHKGSPKKSQTIFQLGGGCARTARSEAGLHRHQGARANADTEVHNCCATCQYRPRLRAL